MLSTVLGNACRLQTPLNANSLTPEKRARTTQTIKPPELTRGAEKQSAHEYIVISSEDEEQPRRAKRQKVVDFCGDNVDFIPYNEVEGELDLDREESRFELTAAQEAVVEMALNGHNIFLTVAAGSGKTATLKEILRHLQTKYLEKGGKGYKEGPEGAGSNFPSVQVVAPTGIAALPLNGKTTYSFAGWYVRRFLAMWFFDPIFVALFIVGSLVHQITQAIADSPTLQEYELFSTALGKPHANHKQASPQGNRKAQGSDYRGDIDG
jgi:hypothetical protein